MERMDIIGIIFCLLALIVIGCALYIIYLLKKKNKEDGANIVQQTEIKDRINNLFEQLTEIKSKNDSTSQTQLKSSTSIDEKLLSLQQTFEELKKDSYQSNIQVHNIYDTVKGMNDIMVNKKTRGNWGEYQLNNLLSIYAGNSQDIYETQYSLKNGYIGDVALHMPNDERVLIIDSKFPVENYQNLLNDDLGNLEIQKYQSLFKQNIKKHINDISKKYITNETMEFAVMFVPSEAIYYYVCSECGDLIDYAHSKHILITSPTTLLGVTFTFINITKDIKRSKNIKALEKDIVGMYEDSVRLSQRLEALDKSINTLQKSIKDVNTSAGKIGNRIVKIHDGYVEEENKEE